jgi:hypothetical protein
MRACNIGLVFVLTLVSRIGFSEEVDYKLLLTSISAFNEQNIDEPFSIAVRDRVWAAPGVEQTTKELLPPRRFDAAAPRRLRFEAAESCRDVGIHRMIDAMNGGPEWLDEVAWPLTRELYGLGQPPYPYDDRQTLTFGGITLQR